MFGSGQVVIPSWEGAVVMLGGVPRRFKFSSPDYPYIQALSGRLEDAVDDHGVWVRLPLR